jgi:hypothetical protein
MQRDGLSEAEARGRCQFIDSKGPVVTSRTDLAEQKRYFARPDRRWQITSPTPIWRRGASFRL